MNKVWIIFRDGKVCAVRSTETLAESAMRQMVKQSPANAKFTIEGWDVPR